MSYSRSTELEAKRKGRIVDTFDYTNIDDFFNQPSAQELTAASERRVEDIMAELDRCTTEAIEDWTRVPYSAETYKHGQYARTRCSSQEYMVSYPATGLSVPLPLRIAVKSNLLVVPSAEYKAQIDKELPHHVHSQTTTCSPQAKLLHPQTERLQPNRTVDGPHNASTRKSSTSQSSKKHYIKFLSPVSPDAKELRIQYPRTPSGNPTSPPLPYPKPLSPVPDPFKKQLTRVNPPLLHSGIGSVPSLHLKAATRPPEHRTEHDSNTNDTDLHHSCFTDGAESQRPRIPATIVTPPPGKQFTHQLNQVKRKALPANSPLFTLREEYPAFTQ